MTTDAEGNIVAVTSEEQEYYDKDSGLSYAYHTQYQLDESGQIDYSKAMVVIPWPSKHPRGRWSPSMWKVEV